MSSANIQYEAIRETDYFPNETSTQVKAIWMDFVNTVDSLLSPDMLAGARQRARDDDQLLDEISVVLDSLYAHFSSDLKTLEAKNK